MPSAHVTNTNRAAYSMLSIFDVKYNEFYGPLPNAIGSLTSLVELNLSNNNFTGEIFGSLALTYSLVCRHLASLPNSCN